jgi:hypothetical protein
MKYAQRGGFKVQHPHDNRTAEEFTAPVINCPELGRPCETAQPLANFTLLSYRYSSNLSQWVRQTSICRGLSLGFRLFTTN